MKQTAAILLALGLPLGAVAAPLGPSGVDPLGAADRLVYAAAGLPSSAVGAQLTLAGWVLGAEAGFTMPGVLRPELHARRPVRLGPAVLAPRLSIAQSLALQDRSGQPPIQSTFELAPGIVAGRAFGRWDLFLDAGLLGMHDFQAKSRLRLLGTAAVGATWHVDPHLTLNCQAGLLLTRLHAAPAGALTAGWSP